jgi:thioredoxin reductase
MHQRGHHVQIFGRSDQVLANKALWDQFRHAGGVPLHLGYVLISVEESVDRIRCRFRNEDQVVEHMLDCLIFATGRDASLEFMNEDILEQMDKLNEMKRLYLAGDVKNGDFRQTSIATGDGIRIAMEIARHESNTENGA